MRLLVVLFWMVLGGTSAFAAQSLSSVECTEIRELYGITPPECASSATPTQTEATAAQRENNIFFPNGGTRLDAEALGQIDRLASVLKIDVMTNTCLKLVGHSDTSGGARTNQRISEQRAQAVRDALAARLEDPARIELVMGLGEEGLLPNLPAESRWQRRVEIWARPCPG